MLLLANRETMAVHMAELLRIRLAQVLSYRGMAPSSVSVMWERTIGGKPAPDFQVGFPEGMDISKSSVRSCIKDVWKFYKDEVSDRFAGMTTRREA